MSDEMRNLMNLIEGASMDTAPTREMEYLISSGLKQLGYEHRSDEITGISNGFKYIHEINPDVSVTGELVLYPPDDTTLAGIFKVVLTTHDSDIVDHDLDFGVFFKKYTMEFLKAVKFLKTQGYDVSKMIKTKNEWEWSLKSEVQLTNDAMITRPWAQEILKQQ